MYLSLRIFCLILLSFNLLNAQIIEELCPLEQTSGTAVSMENYNGTTYTTGFFSTICGQTTSYLAEYNNGDWEPSALELTYPGHMLRTIGDNLFVTTYVELPNDSNWLYKYDGSSIEKVGTGAYLSSANGLSNLANIYDVVEYNSELYICGEFDKIGSQSIQGIAKWNGTQWDEVDGGLAGNIENTAPLLFPHQMMVFDGALYVVGNFKTAGGIECNGIAKYDGTAWSNMNNGFPSTSYSISHYNGEIYCGGDWSISGSENINRIAKWDGTEWVSPGFGFEAVGANDYIFVHTIKQIDDLLYVAGGIKSITIGANSPTEAGGIIAFDGTNVETFGAGVSGNDIEGIAKNQNGEILVGGGVFGNGYLGIITQENNTNELGLYKPNFYPNPVEDYLSFESDHALKNIKIFDAGGLLKKQAIISGNIDIDVNDLEPGFYFVHYTLGNKTQSFKFIKM